MAIRGDMSGFSSDLKRAEGETTASASRMQLTFKNILSAGALFGIGTSLHQLVQGTIRELGDAASAFSELQQTQRTVDEVFGESARVIEDWAKRSADAAGMSQRTVFQSAAVMGQTLQNMGFSAEEAADKVVMLQQRAAELAIAFGSTPERAILAITAAMRGERDTIEKFGVAIKQVDVNSRVAALGLDVSTDAAKKNSEAIAILDLILEQSAGQADRFAGSQDDLAVQMAQTAAKIDDFMTTEVGPAVASIQLGAIKTTTFFGEELDKFALHFGDQTQTIMRLADEAGVGYEVMHQRIINAMDLTGLSFPEVVATFTVEGINVSDQVEADYMDAALAAGAGVGKMTQAANEALLLGGPVIAAEAGKIAGMLPEELEARIDDVKAAAEDLLGPDGLAGGILAAQQKPLDAIAELNRVMEESLSEAEQIAKLTGEETVTALTTGLESPLLVDRLAANAAAKAVIDQLLTLGPAGYAAGVALAQQLGIGIDHGAADPVFGPAAAARRMALGIRNPFPQSEPKDPKSALRGWPHLGADMVRQLAGSIEDELGTASAASRALAGALSPSLAMPGGMTATMAPASSLLSTMPAGGNNITVQMIDRVEKRSVDDIGYGLKRLDDLGKLPGSRTGVR